MILTGPVLALFGKSVLCRPAVRGQWPQTPHGIGKAPRFPKHWLPMIIYHPGWGVLSWAVSCLTLLGLANLLARGKWHVGFAFSLAGSVLPKACLWGVPSGILAVGLLVLQCVSASMTRPLSNNSWPLHIQYLAPSFAYTVVLFIRHFQDLLFTHSRGPLSPLVHVIAKLRI